jgi:hypothetical protein
VSRELQKERNENRSLHNTLNHILKEIELKAPIIQKQRQEYEAAILQRSQMTLQLEAAMHQCDSLSVNLKLLNKENAALKQGACDSLSICVDIFTCDSLSICVDIFTCDSLSICVDIFTCDSLSLCICMCRYIHCAQR